METLSRDVHFKERKLFWPDSLSLKDPLDVVNPGGNKAYRTLLSMWKLRLKKMNPLLGVSIAAGFGFLGLGFAKIAHTHSLHDESTTEVVLKHDQNVKFKVGIIGSGIGGTTAAYFIRKALGSNVQIDVFEKENKVGGRMSVVKVDNDVYEAGGSVIHESNRYLTDFCQILGLDKLSRESDRIGIYNGTEFVYVSTGYSLIDKLKLFIRYGFSLIKMGRFTTETIEKFKSIYKIQDDGKSFEAVPDLLYSLGGEEFVELTRETAANALEKRGISKRVVDELATAVSRNNYGQDMGINAFTGFVSLAGAQSGKLWAVKGGNSQICKGILNKADVNLKLNTKVDSISRQVRDTGNVKYSLNVNGHSLDEIYDAIVIAVPLEVKSAYLSCVDCDNWPGFEELGSYQKTVATIVKGSLNYTAFGFTHASALPDAIFIMENPELDFSSVEVLKTVEDKRSTEKGLAVYKVFSRNVLTKEQIDKYFSECESMVRVEWLAYPHYTPPEKFTAFKLDNGLFYVNAIERTASAMEMSAIGGRNAALLVLKHLKLNDDDTKWQEIHKEEL